MLSLAAKARFSDAYRLSHTLVVSTTQMHIRRELQASSSVLQSHVAWPYSVISYHTNCTLSRKIVSSNLRLPTPLSSSEVVVCTWTHHGAVNDIHFRAERAFEQHERP